MNAQNVFATRTRHVVPRVAEAGSRFSRIYRGLLASLGFAAFLSASITAQAAAVAPTMGAAQSFAVLGNTTVTNTGPSVVTGDLGLSPGIAITGFPPGSVVGGTIHQTDATAASAQTATTTAYNALAGQACDFGPFGPTDLAGQTLVPGVYCYSSSVQNTGKLTLNGSASDVWVFKTGSTLTTGPGSSVVVTGGAQSCNVFWQVGSSATLGTTTNFAGNILALASITLNTGANLSGRALARTGAVTLDSNAASVCSLVAPPGPTIPPTLGKAFSPSTITAGGVSTLTVTLSNANASVATLTAPLSDTLPSGVVIAATPNAATTCTGAGAPVAVAGGSTVTLPAGRSIPANGSCTLTVDVAAAAGGSYINNLVAGALVTSNGSNVAPVVATLTVNPPVGPVVVAPTLGKAFNPASINAGGVSTLTVTLSNPNATVATLTSALIDTLPGGVLIAATPNAATTCTGAGAVSAVAGGSTVTLPSGRSIPANGSCTLTVDVTAATGGSYINTLLAGALVTSNGNNTAPVIATLTVVPPGVIVPPPPPVVVAPTLGKVFSPAGINAGGVSTLTVTLSNPNATVATLTSALIDTLPGGVVIAATPNAATTCTGAGAVSAVAGGSTMTLPSGRSIPANGSCTLTANVTAAVAGTYVNTLLAGALVTSNGSNTAPAVATLTVSPPGVVVPPPVVVAPSLGKTFSPASINAGGVSTLTITLSNPNATVATLTAVLIDNLPSGVAIAALPNVATTCTGSGAPVAMAGGFFTVLPAGRSIPANGNCTLTVDVTAATGGTYVNTLPAGALVTSNGINPAPAVDTLTVIGGVVPPPPPPPPPVIPPSVGIPTLSEWSMIMLVAFLLISGFVAMRRQTR